MDVRHVGILLFEDVEVLDFAGPFEVFSRTRLEPGPASRRTEDSAPFRLFTIAKTATTLHTTGGLQVVADMGFEDHPPIDILVIPGGFGTRALLHDQATLDWIRERGSHAEKVTSVCTGALLLAKAGMLSGQAATTHWGAYEDLAALDATIEVRRDVRYVESKIVTSAGVAAGIDMAFSVVERLCGKEVADETAQYIEYPRGPIKKH